MSPYLAWFDEIPDEELAHAAGGKGASLCRMSRAGLPVPKGFIVRSEMFNAFMEANGSGTMSLKSWTPSTSPATPP